MLTDNPVSTLADLVTGVGNGRDRGWLSDIVLMVRESEAGCTFTPVRRGPMPGVVAQRVPRSVGEARHGALEPRSGYPQSGYRSPFPAAR